MPSASSRPAGTGSRTSPSRSRSGAWRPARSRRALPEALATPSSLAAVPPAPARHGGRRRRLVVVRGAQPAMGSRTVSARPAHHRRAGVRRSWRRRAPEASGRRLRRGSDHRARPIARPARDRPQFQLHLQGQAGRRAPGRPGARRALRARGQPPDRPRARAGNGAADRCRHRRAPLDRALRSAAGRPVRGARRGGGPDRRDADGL